MARVQMLNINEVKNQNVNAHFIESYWESNCAKCGKKIKNGKNDYVGEIFVFFL